MKPAQLTAIGAAVVLTAGIYFGTNRVPPPKVNANAKPARPAEGAMHQKVSEASFDSILLASKVQLPKAEQEALKKLESEATKHTEGADGAKACAAIADLWKKNNNGLMYAYYSAQSGKLENSAKQLTFAAQLFLNEIEKATSESVQSWEISQATGFLEASLKIDSNNNETKLALATIYVQGGGEPMKGVMLLRGITEKNPDDVPANMLLGRMSIQSGQNDKAIKRFETVLKKDPQNSEAMFFLAQAYEALGNKSKAIELLTQCKKLVNKPEFSREIDEKINTLK